MSTVLLVGAFGQGNPGDEALCQAFVGALREHDVVVASADPAATAARHGVRAVGNGAGEVARVVRSADAVVIGGGTVFKSLHRSTGRRPLALLRNATALVAAARARGAKVAMVGVGAGDMPGPTAPRLARWLVRHVDLLVLRDEESAAALSAVGAPTPFWIGADPAWVLDDPSPQIDRRRSSVTIAVSHFAGHDTLVANLADAVARRCPDDSVHVQPWQVGDAGDDYVMAERLVARLGDRASIVAPPTDLEDATTTFCRDRLVISLRFHGLVAAARAGTPFLAVAHEPKLAALSRRLEQISVPPHASRETFEASIDHALRSEPATSAAVAGEARAARHTLDLVSLLLSDGDLAQPDELGALPLSDGAGRW